MANGVQLATAYVSLNVNTKELGKQIRSSFASMERQASATGMLMGRNVAGSMRSSLASGSRSGSLFKPLEVGAIGWAAAAGRKIGGTLRTALVAGLTGGLGVALLGVAGAISGALTSGLARLQTLQQSRIQLSLKLNPQEITDIQNQISEIVTGTNVTLEEAMSAVPKAINSKMSVEATKQYVKDVADAAAATGGKSSFGWLDDIFTQIRTAGYLATEEIQQLTTAGLDVRGMLRDAFGWDDKTLDKNLKDKTVRIEEVQQAIQKVVGSVDAANGRTGLAQLLGTSTLDGSIKAARSSLSRIGANFISALVGKDPSDDPLTVYAEGINKVTEALRGVERWINDNRGEIREFWLGTEKVISAVYEAIKGVVGAFKEVGSAAQQAGTWVSNTWDRVGDRIKSIADTVQQKFNDFFGPDSWLARQFKRLGDLVDKVREVLGIGPATANAAAPGGSPGGSSGGGTSAFNPGPMAPGVAAGQQPLGGSTQGLQSVPGFGLDPNGNPLVPSGNNSAFNPGPRRPGSLSVQMPSQSVVGAPIYSGPVTQDTGGAVEPRNALVQDLIKQQFGDSGAWIGNDYRKPDGYNEHSSGQAADIMVSNLGERTEEGIALGDRINKWLLDNAEKIGLQYTIWNGMLYRPDGSKSPNPGQGITGNHEDHVHYRVKPGKIDQLPQFAGGGGVWGAGTATSDSIPAMLSNGEHVLTAKDVKAMGGQDSVYKFRAALQSGMIPGFETGGQVDPDVLLQRQNQLQDQAKATEIAQAQLQETLANPDATDLDKLQAQIGFSQQNRSYQQSLADYPIIAAGGTPPDRSTENQILDATDDLKLSQAQLDALPEDAPASQRIAAQAAVDRARRSRQQGIDSLNQGNTSPDYLGEFFRSAGFTPTAAGNTGVAGTSSLSALFTSANEVVGGLIDTGASLAQTAISAAATAGAAAGTFGAGTAAGPAAGAAASYGIQVGAQVAKRLSAFGFQLGAIGADSLVAQAFPLGAPRWLGYDYTAFAPQLGIQQAALTTLEKMGGDAINRAMNPGGNQFQVPPEPSPGTQPVATPQAPSAPNAPVPAQPSPPILQPGDPGFYNAPMTVWPFNPNGAGGGGGGGSWAQGGAIKVYDEGGVLKPGDLALNASTRPEKILTQKQWDSLAKLQPGQSSPMVKIDAIYGLSPEDVASQIESKQKLAMMRYAGRP